MDATTKPAFVERGEFEFAGPHPGHQALGRARDFIRKVHETNNAAVPALQRVGQAARSGYKGRPLKMTYLIEVQSLFNSIPVFGSVIRTVDRSKDGLSIKEVRLDIASLSVDNWTSGRQEKGLNISVIFLHIDKHICEMSTKELAFIGFHALARRMQRSYEHTYDAVMSDIGDLFRSYSRIMQQSPGHDRFTAQAKDGRWSGERCSYPARDMRILRVQTFLAPSWEITLSDE